MSTTDATENYFTRDKCSSASPTAFLTALLFLNRAGKCVKSSLSHFANAGSILRSRTTLPPSFQCSLYATVRYCVTRFALHLSSVVLSSCVFGFLTIRTVGGDDKAIQINPWIIPDGRNLSVSREKSSAFKCLNLGISDK